MSCWATRGSTRVTAWTGTRTTYIMRQLNILIVNYRTCVSLVVQAFLVAVLYANTHTHTQTHTKTHERTKTHTL
jgi:hypothetical protein